MDLAAKEKKLAKKEGKKKGKVAQKEQEAEACTVERFNKGLETGQFY